MNSFAKALTSGFVYKFNTFSHKSCFFIDDFENI